MLGFFFSPMDEIANCYNFTVCFLKIAFMRSGSIGNIISLVVHFTGLRSLRVHSEKKSLAQ